MSIDSSNIVMVEKKLINNLNKESQSCFDGPAKKHSVYPVPPFDQVGIAVIDLAVITHKFLSMSWSQMGIQQMCTSQFGIAIFETAGGSMANYSNPTVEDSIGFSFRGSDERRLARIAVKKVKITINKDSSK